MSDSTANLEQGDLPSRRQIRTVGPSGNYWYVVAVSKDIKPGELRKVRFWKQDIVVFRTQRGTIKAIEDRCPHRQLPLSEGFVEDDNLVCTYHGWKFDGCGKCVEILHELGKGRTRMPKIKVKNFAVKEQWGLIWLFPGDQEKAEQVALPDIPQLDGDNPWPFCPIEVSIESHFTMIVENVCDFNHEYLHRKKQPFSKPTLRKWTEDDSSVRVYYDTKFDQSVVAKLFTEDGARDLNDIHIWYEYPYQGSDIGGKYIHWLFMLPEDERTTRCFFVFLFGPIRFPIINKRLPDFLRKPVLWITNKMYIIPLLGEDKWALELEQDGFERHSRAAQIELNPAVAQFQKLSLRKWAEYIKPKQQAADAEEAVEEKIAESA